MGSRSVRLFHEHVLVKEPDSDVPTPWHHDQPYYSVDGTQTCSLWIPLDSVPRDTVPEFVAGSHQWGHWFRPDRFNKTALNADDGLEPVPDIDGERGRYNILGWAMEPGDAVAFNYLTLHGAPANRQAANRRRAFSLAARRRRRPLGRPQGRDLAALPRREAVPRCCHGRAGVSAAAWLDYAVSVSRYAASTVGNRASPSTQSQR